MPTDRELLLSLRKGFEELEPFDGSRLNALRNRGQMIIRRVFGASGAYYSERLSSIEFYYTGPVMIVAGEPESPSMRRSRENIWRGGQSESIALVDTMLEDLELSEAERTQTG